MCSPTPEGLLTLNEMVCTEQTHSVHRAFHHGEFYQRLHQRNQKL